MAILILHGVAESCPGCSKEPDQPCTLPGLGAGALILSPATLLCTPQPLILQGFFFNLTFGHKT